MYSIDLGANEQESSIFKTTDFDRAHDVLKNRIKAAYRFDLINLDYLATVGNPVLLQGDRIAKFLLEYIKQAREWKKAYTDKTEYPKWRDALLPKVSYPETILERHMRYFREVSDAIPKSIREPWSYTPPKETPGLLGPFADALKSVAPYAIAGLAIYAFAGGIGKGIASRAK